MRVGQWRPAAWAALALGGIIGPASAAPPTGTSQHTVRGTSAATTHTGGGAPARTTASTGGGATVTPASGQPNTKAHTETALSLLHDAHRAVSGTHFRYDGHRAEALKEIDRAVRELTPPKPPNPNPQPVPHQAPTVQQAPRPSVPVVPQTRAEADAKLQQAIVLLGRAHGRISGNANATEDIGAAVTALKAALQVPVR